MIKAGEKEWSSCYLWHLLLDARNIYIYLWVIETSVCIYINVNIKKDRYILLIYLYGHKQNLLFMRGLSSKVIPFHRGTSSKCLAGKVAPAGAWGQAFSAAPARLNLPMNQPVLEKLDPGFLWFSSKLSGWRQVRRDFLQPQCLARTGWQPGSADRQSSLVVTARAFAQMCLQSG